MPRSSPQKARPFRDQLSPLLSFLARPISIILAISSVVYHCPEHMYCPDSCIDCALECLVSVWLLIKSFFRDCRNGNAPHVITTAGFVVMMTSFQGKTSAKLSLISIVLFL